MWKLKIAKGNNNPHLYSTNNFVGRQIWEFEPNGTTNEERREIENAREFYYNNRRREPSGDMLMRIQLIKESGMDLLSTRPVKLKENEEVNYEAITVAVKKALQLNRAIQANDGHWPAENGGPLFFTPPLIIALYISGTINTVLTKEHIKEIIRYIYNHQNDDGGWGFYIGGHSTMIGSALNYVTLRLLGERLDGNDATKNARKWILDRGGATGIPSWGKIYLSILGVYEWEGCNPVPPEFWLFPSFLPFHPAKMWVYCRTAYMPMSYLYGKRYHGPITDLVLALRQELYPIPYAKINWNKERHNCCKDDLYYPHSLIQDLLWDGLQYFFEPIIKIWPFNKLRNKALQRTADLMHYGAEESRYITTGCVAKFLQLICAWEENPDGLAFKHHIARTPDYLWVAEDGMKVQSFGSQSWDCSFATQAIITSDMVEEYGDSLKKAHFYLQESQVKENPSGDYSKMCRWFTKGSWTFSDQDQSLGVSDGTADALICLLKLSQMPSQIVGEKVNVERLYEAVNFILSVQSPASGGFAAWEPPVPQPYLQMLNPSELFADIVVDKEHVECTGSVIAALVEFKRLHPGHRETEIQISIEKAVYYLEEKQCHDGSWYGFWGICFIYGTYFALKGLAAAGKTYDNNKSVRKAVHFLLSNQNEHGGWGESIQSCTDEKFTPLDGNRTNFVQTAWAMLSLMYGGQVERDPTPLHKSAKVLINAQMDNGDFPQQEISGAYMKYGALHYAEYRNIFPFWALAEYRKRVWSPTQKP